MNGMGGDLFVLYWEAKTGKLTGLNASGYAPRGLTQFLSRQGWEAMPGSGIHSVTVPGAVDGWAKLHQRYGKLAWPRTFRSGHRLCGARLSGDGGDCGAFGPAGRLPNGCSRMRPPPGCFFATAGRRSREIYFAMPELAHANRLLASEGPRAFYRGRHRPRGFGYVARAGWNRDRGRFIIILRRMGRADFNRLPRMEGLRIASQWTGHGRSRNAQHHGNVARRARWAIHAAPRCTNGLRR